MAKRKNRPQGKTNLSHSTIGILAGILGVTLVSASLPFQAHVSDIPASNKVIEMVKLKPTTDCTRQVRVCDLHQPDNCSIQQEGISCDDPICAVGGCTKK